MTKPREEVEILLVEDNPDDVELTLHALRSRHVANRIHVARDGAEALAYLLPPGGAATPGETDARPLPRLVLLDLKLPKVSGLEVLAKLKANPATARIPVVMLTSSREDRDIEEAYRLGVNSYIVKPVEFENFAGAVQSLDLYWMVLNQPPTV